MKAGRELDALVAEKVMGLVFCDNVFSFERTLFYSTSIADAWQVVEKLAKDGDEHPVCMQKGLPASGDHATPFEVLKNYAGYPGWTCYFADYEVCAHADTAPLAICLAALKAVGVEVPE